MKLWKRNAVAAAIVLLVCGAVYINGTYTQDTAAARNLGEAALVGSRQDPLAEETAAAPADGESGAAEDGEEAAPEGEHTVQSEGSYFSTASRPGTMPCPCFSRPPPTRRRTRTQWTRPTPPSRPWPATP